MLRRWPALAVRVASVPALPFVCSSLHVAPGRFGLGHELHVGAPRAPAANSLTADPSAAARAAVPARASLGRHLGAGKSGFWAVGETSLGMADSCKGQSKTEFQPRGFLEERQKLNAPTYRC